MVTSYGQGELQLAISTALGDDVVLLSSVTGSEGISEPFFFELGLLSEKNDLDFDTVLWKGASIKVARPGGSGDRYFHGVITRFVQIGSDARFTHYRAELRPWFWLLHHTSDCRIFQNKSVPDILSDVFKELGFSDFRLSLKASYEPREYCVQYRESYFDFASRLMESEGIFYFFEHTDNAHTLVLADDRDAHQSCDAGSKLEYRGRRSAFASVDDILDCEVEGTVTASKYNTDDYNFETPEADLLVSDGDGTLSKTIYEYPGDYAKKARGSARARVRLQELEQPKRRLTGSTATYSFTSGYKFTLSRYPRDDANGDYVLRSVAHSATQNGYSNTFDAFPLDLPFRPPRLTPKPRIPGTQTAMVVGKQGEEIWTDKYGRVKLKFHWDQDSAEDENSSCWIRVSQEWAGKQWGAMHIPRIGQEVIVSFLEGDPDRPIVTGRVYNAERMPPYPLPDKATISGYKSNSSKGGGGFNEIHFEDKKGDELMFIHAEKDQEIRVSNDRSETIGGDRSLDITGKQVVTIGKTLSLTVTDAVTETFKSSYSQAVTDDSTVKAKSVLIEATEKITIQVGGSSITLESGSVKIDSGGTIDVEAGAIASVKGSMVKIN
jgi:type VI secretion system secreted protein VgrG